MTRPPSPPGVRLASALESSEPLARLLQRVAASRACFQAVQALLPPGLGVRPGPLDDEGWTLLAPHAAAAAKLRQLLPRIAQALAEGGHAVTAVRVKIQPPG